MTGLAEKVGQPAAPIGTQWEQYIFKVDDLPLEGVTSLRARFDLMGAGEVWADDVQLFDLVFDESELRALYKLLTLAEPESVARRREMIREVDANGLIATPANSYINELVVEAARASILADGRPVRIVYGDDPHVEMRK